MIEKKIQIGGVSFSDTTAHTTTNPYIIAAFGDENCGKTRLGLTGPDGVGVVALEMKTYKTIDKVAAELGKRVFKPTNPMDLLVSKRKVDAMQPTDQQLYYMAHYKKIQNITYAMLENKAVNLVMMDKFSTYCNWVELGLYGPAGKFIKVEGQVYRDKKEFNTSVIDFINSLSEFGKPVLLNCASRDDYDVVGADKKPFRKTWDGFKYLGSHANLVVEMADNKFWDLKKAALSDALMTKCGWRYRLNVRRSQDNPMLEGPDGNPLLEDDMIALPNLIMQVNPDADMEVWL